MKGYCWSLLQLAFTGAALATVPLSDVKRISSTSVVPNKFVVEVESASEIPGKRSLYTPHELFYRSLSARGVSYEVNKEFNSEGLFVGAVVTVSDANDVKALAQTPGVKAIRPVRTIKSPKPVKVHVVTGKDDPEIPADTESTHIMTGVNKLHAQGIFGAGIKIGIIDTGIDYTHPALGGALGAGHKVIGGYDFVGDAYDGTNTPVPDNDPLDQCNGHGTHVAGIIGANPDNQFNISGVSYGASLSSYRVFGCSGSVSDDIIIEALLRGVQDGQDILTLSLGGADGWTESSSSVVASRIAASGKIVTIAAGNEGAYGSWYSSSPGNGIDVISVASIDNTVDNIQNATVNGVEHDPIPYFKTLPLPFASALPLYVISNDTTIANDACNALPDSTPDLSGFLVLVRRGSCTFVQKLTNIAAKGGNAVFIYDNGNGFAGIETGKFTNATLIQAADGVFLAQQVAAGKNITITFPQTGGSAQIANPSGGLVSSFTTYGPTNDLYFKPAVGAPGGNILSTLPVPLGSYGVESGTSMATPYVAGSAALLLSVKGRSADVALSARALFQSTAQRVPSSHTDGDPLQTLSQQGAGLVDVFKALYTETIVWPTELILNDTAHYQEVHTFTVKNTGKTSKQYKLTHVPAGTAQTITSGTIFAADGPVPLSADYATVKLSSSSFTLRPGQSKQITTHIDAPSGVDASAYPVFSGFIEIATATESVHVTYLGLAASLKDKQIVDNTNEFFGITIPAVLNNTGDAQLSPTNYTFGGSDFPTLLLRLAFGTPLLRVDLVDAKIDLKPTLNSREIDDRRHVFERESFSFPHPGPKGSTFAQVKIVGTLSEQSHIPRNTDASTVDDGGYSTFAFNKPTFANGTTIPNGTYRWLLRALKVTGDPTKEADFETWLSPIVGVTVA